MKQRIAAQLIRWARRLDPSIISHVHTCVGNPGHYGDCCCDCAHLWKDARHGGLKPQHADLGV